MLFFLSILKVHINLSKNNCFGSRFFLCRTITHCKNDRYVTDIKLAPILSSASIQPYRIVQQMCVQAAASVAQSTTTTTPRTAHPSAPVYNTADNLPVLSGGRVSYQCRLTTPGPVHLSEPPLILWTSLPSVYCGLVYIDTPEPHLSA